ncbi:Cullin-4B [Thelohanellus kitauei]|uniref:Cullin-4B n=1 Tax=Thelohanellus kitauei TaxID=669202 RepID=A0A0C2IIV8_THEKT|nr:Cullin-4B [Thelohanellus kitauei]
MNVPPEFIQRMQLFDEFYHQTHKTSRELSWPLYLGQCLVHINYKNGIREIECGFIEALILKSFVTSKSISVDSLLQQFGIADTPYETELHIAIQSLACGNHRIIFKKPPGINVCNTDVIRLNYDFTHPSYRIKIEKFTTPEEEVRCFCYKRHAILEFLNLILNSTQRYHYF